MNIDPMLPVNMSATIMLNTSDLLTWIPALAAFLTVLVTFVIVKLMNDLSFKKMRVLLEQNKEIEDKKLAASYLNGWIEKLIDALVDFLTEMQSVAVRSAEINYEMARLENKNDNGDEVFDGEYKDILSEFEMVKQEQKKLYTKMIRVMCLIDLNNELHKKMFSDLTELYSSTEEMVRKCLETDEAIERRFMLSDETIKLIYSVLDEARKQVVSLPVDPNP